MGNKALSHDSVFIFESVSGSAAGDTSSQECIPGRVKTLQVRTSFSHSWCYLPLAVSQETLLLVASAACCVDWSIQGRTALDLFCLLEAASLNSCGVFSLVQVPYCAIDVCPRVCELNLSLMSKSSSNGIPILYFIAAAFGLRPLICTVFFGVVGFLLPFFFQFWLRFFSTR